MSIVTRPQQPGVVNTTLSRHKPDNHHGLSQSITNSWSVRHIHSEFLLVYMIGVTEEGRPLQVPAILRLLKPSHVAFTRRHAVPLNFQSINSSTMILILARVAILSTTSTGVCPIGAHLRACGPGSLLRAWAL